MIGDAIRKATDELFEDGGEQYKDIILITDGEDHESIPEEAAAKAGVEGIRIIAIGLGDEEEGTPIPVTGKDGRKTFLTYDGEIVKSRLDGETLRKVAFNSAGGYYLPVKTGVIYLDRIDAKDVSSAAKRQLEETTMLEYDEKFQVFLGLAIFIIVCEMLISERKKNL